MGRNEADIALESWLFGFRPRSGQGQFTLIQRSASTKVGIPNFVSGPREYIIEGEYVLLAMCSWFCIS